MAFFKLAYSFSLPPSELGPPPDPEDEDLDSNTDSLTDEVDDEFEDEDAPPSYFSFMGEDPSHGGNGNSSKSRSNRSGSLGETITISVNDSPLNFSKDDNNNNLHTNNGSSTWISIDGGKIDYTRNG